jgi:hypothetical protein
MSNYYHQPYQPHSIQSVDFLRQENAIVHHTEKYETVHRNPGHLVVRRGFPFTIRVHFYSPFNVQDLLRISFEYGNAVQVFLTSNKS